MDNNLKTSTSKDAAAPTQEEENCVREQERLLPIANVGRLMKKILPTNAKVSKEAKETMQECVSEFIAFVTGEASDKCRRERRKTVNGDDICWALGTLGFDDYTVASKRYLQRYREMEGDTSNANSNSHDKRGNTSIQGADQERDIETDLLITSPTSPPNYGLYHHQGEASGSSTAYQHRFDL